MDHGDLGWPIGGSLAFARNLERQYRALGGEVRYRSGASKVLVEGGRAVGVRLDDGSELRADIVVSACDGRSTLLGMLDGRYLDELQRQYYEEWAPDRQELGLQVALGVDRDLSEEPHALSLFLPSPIMVEGQERERLDLELYPSSTGLAPPGKGVIKATFPSSYAYWAALRASGGYDEEKAKIARAVVAALEARFPGLGGQVEVTDVCTLLTAERYTSNYHGLQAWPARNEQRRISSQGLSRTLPGLKNFYMAGQWAEATIGIHTAAVSARRVVKQCCREDGKPFVGDVKK